MTRIIIIAAIAIYGTTYYWLNSRISELEASNNRKSTIINKAKLKNEILKSEVEKSKLELDKQNKAIDTVVASYAKDMNELHKKLSKKPKVVYKEIHKKVYTKLPDGSYVDYRVATCKEGLELNKAISNLKYKDLVKGAL